jgi:alkyl hydroperoxide reductase subunit AhpC
MPLLDALFPSSSPADFTFARPTLIHAFEARARGAAVPTEA